MNSEQLYVMLANLEWKRAVVFGSLLGILYFLAFYDDGSLYRRNLEQIQGQIQQTEQQLKVTKEAFDNAARFEQEVKTAVDQFSTVTEYMPESMGPSEMMSIVTDLVGKTGLKLVKTEPRPGGERAEFYEPVRMMVALEGSFSQVLMFLSHLSKVPKLITFEGAELATVANTDPEMPRLLFSGTIIGYRYLAKRDEQKAGGGTGGR